MPTWGPDQNGIPPPPDHPREQLPRRPVQLEPDMKQRTGSKWGKEYIKAVYCHPAYLTYMQSTSCKMPGWMNYNLELRFLGEILTASNMQMIPP